jgi:hypothetical protein
MESQQIMELLLAMREEMRAGQEEANIKAEARHAQLMADWKAWGEERRASHKKIVPEKEMTAYRELEAHQQDEPTSVETKPESAEHQEVPVEDAPRIPVGEPKKRRRDHKLAADRRCQKKLAVKNRN